ncbi:hydrolase [Flavobacteriaceae bacterium]|nr:hydrolase [Flavobacteriaceae bacterium]
MKSRIYMYLFFFSILLVLFMYVNQSAIFERQTAVINSLEQKQSVLKDSITTLNQEISELLYFDLLTNDSARTYFEQIGLEPEDAANQVKERIYEYNLQKGGNPLVPFANANGQWRINRIKFLNHRWIIADCSDGRAWGELWIEYFFDQEGQLDLTVESSVLYP